ncbi:MAG: acriflavine resistance protein B [Proteobacteria bacterium]|nr:MAG: acriflavine resistance protein B [Pseudomonadota bacterium]
MNLTRSAIDNNRVTAVILIVVLFAGWQAFNSLPRAEDPGFIIRTAQVMTSFPGASPERVEKLVTDRLEKAIQEIPELDFVSSSSKTGLSVINVNIRESEKVMRPIWDSLRRKIEREAPKLPAGCGQPVINDEFGDVFGIVLALTGDGYSYAQLKAIADQMRDELLRLPDTAKVTIYGAQDERVFIEYKNSRLAEVGLSPAQLKQILQAQNIVNPGGSVRIGEQRIAIEPSGNFESVEQIGKTVVQLPQGGQLLYLKDLVTIRRGYIDPPRQKVHSSTGTRLLHQKKLRFPVKAPATAALVLAVSMRDGGKLTELGAQVERLLQHFNEIYPIGVQVEKAIFQPQDVQEVVSGFTSSLFQAIAIVMVAMLLFLGLRTGLIVAALIPTAVMSTLMVMRLLGVGLDQISLAALIIALGMLVDNGVVMAESTLVYMSAGDSAREASIRSAKELRIPLLTSSLTTSAAFLPIFLAKSAVGEYTAALFIVVTIALLSSWVLSLTMTPMLCALLLKPSKRTEPPNRSSRFYRGYRRFLLLFVRRPLITVALIVAVFVGGMQLFGLVPQVFFPGSDRPTSEVQIQLLTGADITTTRQTLERIERYIHDELKVKKAGDHGVTKWVSFIGQGAPRYYLSYGPEPPNAGYAIMLMTHDDYPHMKATLAKLRSWCYEQLPGVKATIGPRSLGPPVKYPVQVRLSGHDTAQLFSIVDKVKAKLRSFPEATNIVDDWGLWSKKLVVKIDQARARRAGVSSQDVALSLQTLFSGLQVTQYRENDKVIPVTMRSVAADRQDLGKLETHQVYAQSSGKSVLLSQIATLELTWEPSKVLRRDRLKTVTVNANLRAGGNAAAINAAIEPWLKEQHRRWGPGVTYALGGEVEKTAKANQSIADQMPIALFLIVLLLVAQFNSLRRTMIIIAVLPLGLVGVAVGLLLAKSYFGFMTLLGVVSLFGIVINNAIVLIERIELEIDENGLEPALAVIQAAQQRLRPILLTTATTIAGLLPLWLGGGPMFEPMAIALIFGLSFATVLTLGVVPTLYALFFRVSFRGFVYTPPP